MFRFQIQDRPYTGSLVDGKVQYQPNYTIYDHSKFGAWLKALGETLEGTGCLDLAKLIGRSVKVTVDTEYAQYPVTYLSKADGSSDMF